MNTTREKITAVEIATLNALNKVVSDDAWRTEYDLCWGPVWGTTNEGITRATRTGINRGLVAA